MEDNEKVDVILKVCEEHTEFSREDILGRSRIVELVYVRHMVISMVKLFTDYSLKQIGIKLGGRNHTTVIHSLREKDSLYKNDKVFKNDFDRLELIAAERIFIDDYKRYFTIVEGAINAFLTDTLIQRRSDACFMGTYVFNLTGKRNTGWYHILMVGMDDEVTEEDIECYRAINYSSKEAKILVDKFDKAEDAFMGLFLASEAAYNLENWEGVENNVNLVGLIDNPDLFNKIMLSR